MQKLSLPPLMSCSYDFADYMLISTFTEMWQLETNTFHLPFSEMTITLDDVRILLQIPVDSKQ
ncbi:hypothetical protein Syun_028805 [Stephania yunnanensis]|uniref:Aminotransferase-like plant mobile domain-containing protein n=1 Tax=Stephania yunnanensis TaxID=152371 RepID=A0AAP0E4D6_9MAGN